MDEASPVLAICLSSTLESKRTAIVVLLLLLRHWIVVTTRERFGGSPEISHGSPESLSIHRLKKPKPPLLLSSSEILAATGSICYRRSR